MSDGIPRELPDAEEIALKSRRGFIEGSGAVSGLLLAGSWHSVAGAEEKSYDTGPIVHRQFPLNSEPRPNVLAAGFVTAQNDFYIRNHGTVPKLSEDGYAIRVELNGVPPTELLLSDLKKSFPRRAVTAVMQCAGNRRADMGKFKAVSGDAWSAGAIGNAVWGGVALHDVLSAAGVSNTAGLHVVFGAHDDIEEEGKKFKYGVSIPLAKALEPDCLLAFEMNGEPLTQDHGFPLRVVIPGFAGVRSPKWLASIKVQARPSDNHIQQKEYKLFPPNVTKQTVDLSKGPFIDDMPLNSAILMPGEGSTIASGTIAARGYAISTTSPVVRVEISADHGRTWIEAMLDHHADAPWSWVPWTAEVKIRKGRQQLMVRAFDAAGTSQPMSPEPIWNYPGYLSRAWHRVNFLAL